MTGVLFLDELPEFSRDALEILRQACGGRPGNGEPGGGQRHLSQPVFAGRRHEPLPVRVFRPSHPACTCPPSAIDRYRQKISGPLLDRIDLHVE